MRLIFTAICGTLWLSPMSDPQTQDVPVSLDRLSENAIVIRVADNPGGTNVTALSTDLGLVVIDTEMSHTIAAVLMEAISGEFARDDFSYVINTHDHWDHTMGNQAFGGSVIIGHENTIDAMHAFDNGKADFAAALREGWIDFLEEELKNVEPNSDSAQTLSRRRLYSSMVCSELEGGFVLTPPSLTFNDRLTLDLGDVKLTLVYVGAAHTKADIIVRVDPDGILVVGDLFSPGGLPYIDAQGDVQVYLSALNSVLDDSRTTTHVVPGHGDLMTAAELQLRRDYVEDLWNEVKTSRQQGLTLDETKELLSFDSRFGHLRELDHTWGDGTDFHLLNIENLWTQLAH